jgi:hypothetical protein
MIVKHTHGSLISVYRRSCVGQIGTLRLSSSIWWSTIGALYDSLSTASPQLAIRRTIVRLANVVVVHTVSYAIT